MAGKFTSTDVQSLRDKILQLPDSDFMPTNPESVQAVREKCDSLVQTNKSDFATAEDLRTFMQVKAKRIGAGKYEIIPESDHRTDRFIVASHLAYHYFKYKNGGTDRSKDTLKANFKCLGYDKNIDINLSHALDICDKANGISSASVVPVESGLDQADDVFPLDEDDAIRIQTSAVSEAVELATASPLPIITEQEKDASDEKARQAVELHQAGKTKSIKEQERESKKQAKPAPKQEPEQQSGENQLSGFSKDGFWNYDILKEIQEEEPDPWLIEGLFRKGSIVSIPAQQNDGKSMLLLNAFGAIASGSRFLPDKDGNGGFQTEQGACIYIDFEGDRDDTVSRVLATLNYFSGFSGMDIKDIPVAVKYMPIDWSGSDDNVPTLIYEAITALPAPYDKPVAIGIDTYTAFSDVENENDRAQATKVFQRLKKLKALFAETGTTIFVTQHLRKLNGKSFDTITMDDISGAGSQAGALSDIWMLGTSTENKDKKLLKQVKAKARALQNETKVLEFRYDNNPDGTLSSFTFVLLSGDDAEAVVRKQQAKRKSSDKEKENQVLTFIAQHQPCSLSRIWKPEYPDRLKMTYATTKAITDSLMASGAIFPNSDGRFMINPYHRTVTEE